MRLLVLEVFLDADFPADYPCAQPRPWFAVATHDFKATVNAYRTLQPAMWSNPGSYVHWNIDNDNETTTVPGDRSKPPIADYTETGPVENEDDLMPLRATVSHLPDKGTVTLSRDGASLRIWSSQIKGPGTEVLVNANSKSWNLANPAERADFLSLWTETHASAKLWIEGSGDGTAGDTPSGVTLTYTPPLGQGTPASTRVKYTFFGAATGRQPTPAERTFLKAPTRWPALIDCEWSITDEPTFEPGVPAEQFYDGSPPHNPVDWATRWYNCYSWTVGETNLWWSHVSDDPPKKVKGIDTHYGRPQPDGKFRHEDLDHFYEQLEDLGPIAKVFPPPIKQAKVIEYEVTLPTTYMITHAALRKGTIASGQLVMFESKLGQFH